MGVVLQMCSCSSQQTIVPNEKSDGIILFNNNNQINTNGNNNIEQIKKGKKMSNGEKTNHEQSNEAETFTNNNISLNGAVVITPKHKRESIYSVKAKKIKKESDKKNNILKRKSHNISEDNIIKKEFPNTKVSDTVLSELIINEKIKTLSKEKKKKLKGRNNINIIIIGYKEVGKSSFCMRFVENKFEDFYIPSICNENSSKAMLFNERNYKINFSVILGGDTIEKPENIFSNVDFFMFLYDITKIRSFNQLNIYLKQIRKYLCFYDKEGKNPNFCLVGNKMDLEAERKIKNEFVNKCLEKNKIPFFEISVKTGKNLNNIVQSFIQIFDKIAFS
jgi:small GTP-binding protein